MLDETWGLKDDQEGIKRTPRKNIIDEDFEKHVEGILLESKLRGFLFQIKLPKSKGPSAVT